MSKNNGVKKETTAIESLMILAKQKNGKIKAVKATKEQQGYILQLLLKTNPEQSILLSKEDIEDVNWESDIDLTV